MSGWKHADEGHHLPWPYDGIGVCSAKGCVCVRPTPDPDSPCGYVFDLASRRPYVCTSVESQDIHRAWPDEPHHPHVPTRCTCGHPLVRA